MYKKCLIIDQQNIPEACKNNAKNLISVQINVHSVYIKLKLGQNNNTKHYCFSISYTQCMTL